MNTRDLLPKTPVMIDPLVIQWLFNIGGVKPLLALHVMGIVHDGHARWVGRRLVIRDSDITLIEVITAHSAHVHIWKQGE